MGVLHLVNSTEGLGRCLDRLGPGDAVILLEAGVYAAMASSGKPEGMDVDLFVLQEHLSQRGIARTRVRPAFTLINFEGFVGLTVRHTRSVTWA
jgi:tRNA 2-thiouridine synthesizing protein B